MKYHYTTVKHNPPETNGDCLRAAIASLLDLELDEVPHFYETGDYDEGERILRDWCASRNLARTWMIFPGKESLQTILQQWGEMNPDTPALLIGSNRYGEDHCVCLIGGEIVHNPDIGQASVVRPNSNGFWNFVVFVQV